MFCCLFGAKPLTEPMMDWILLLDTWEQFTVKFKSKYKKKMYAWNAVEIVVWKKLSRPQCVDQNFDGHRNVGGHTSKFYRLHGARPSADSVMIKFVYRICTALAREGYFDKSYHKYYKRANKIICMIYCNCVTCIFSALCQKWEMCFCISRDQFIAKYYGLSIYCSRIPHDIQHINFVQITNSQGKLRGRIFFFGTKDGACITHAV